MLERRPTPAGRFFTVVERQLEERHNMVTHLHPAARTGLISLAASIGLLVGALTVHAANPDPVGPVYTNPCWWQGFSYFGANYGMAETNRAGGTCTQLFHVHAYFWDSGIGSYVFQSANGYGTSVTVWYNSPTTWIWGYHE